MRDIRDDLRERLGKLRAERDRLQAELHAKLQEIATYEERLTALLEIEETRVAAEQPKLALDYGPPAPELRELPSSPKDRLESVILVLLRGGNTLPHTAIKEQLERGGFGQGNRLFGRSLQGTLMSLRSRGLVELVGKGTWRGRLAARANGS